MQQSPLLADIAAFVHVVDAASFTVASKRLGVPKSTLSRSVSRLEEGAKTRLLVRTTRSMSLTEAGRSFYDRVAPHLLGIADATKLLGDDEDDPHGLLRITAPVDIAAPYLGDTLARFTARYPRVRLEVDLTGRIVDLAKEGFDVAIRATSKLADGPYVAKKLLASELHFFASPAYVARRGAPKHPDELAQHEMVLFEPRGSPGEWPIKGPEGLRKLAIEGRIVCNDFALVRTVLRAGVGVGVLPSFLAVKDLASGTLVRVLAEWSRQAGTLYLITPSAQHVPKKVQVFRQFVIDSFRTAPR